LGRLTNFALSFDNHKYGVTKKLLDVQ
jgi:hypothetical protein